MRDIALEAAVSQSTVSRNPNAARQPRLDLFAPSLIARDSTARPARVERTR